MIALDQRRSAPRRRRRCRASSRPPARSPRPAVAAPGRRPAAPCPRTPPGQRPRRRRGRPAAWSSLVITTARGMPPGALLPQVPGAASTHSLAATTKSAAVRGAQTGAQLADEVGVPRGVEQVDLGPARARAVRPPAPPTAGVPCSDSSKSDTVVPSVDRPGPADGARGDEQRLQEGGLARSARARPGRRCGSGPARRLQVVLGDPSRVSVRHGPTQRVPGLAHKVRTGLGCGNGPFDVVWRE